MKFRAFIRNACSPVWLLNGRMDTITRDILTASVASDSHWLDVGFGLKPFVSSFNDASYTGIDVKVSGRADELKLPDKYFDGVNIPYEDCMFDGILSTQVLEHVENLDILLSECKRVLKPGGRLLIQVWAFEQPDKSRNKFTIQDNYVPYKSPDKTISEKRFYHVFKSKELDNLINKISTVKILESYWEIGNWVIIIEKI